VTEYLLLHTTDPTAEDWNDDEDPRKLAEWVAARRATPLGHHGSPVGPRRQAKSVTVRDGETHVTDGPFSEFKEWFMGFDLIEAESMEEAVQIAAGHPSAKIGRLYVLPNVSEWKDER